MTSSKSGKRFLLFNRLFFCLITIGLLSSACNLPANAPAIFTNLTATKTPFQPGAGDENSLNIGFEKGDGSSGQEIARWWLSPALPGGLRKMLALPEGTEVVEDRAQSHLAIAVNEGQAISHWLYALVAPFPTLTEEVSLNNLKANWRGQSAGPFAGIPLMMSAETAEVFSAWWGEAAEGAVQVIKAENLLNTAWAQQPSWAILPFEELEPKWKVLAVDGQSPIWKDFDSENYALSVPIGISGDEALAAGAMERFGPESSQPLAPSGNRDAKKLTAVILTGVTALVRATAWEMERKGITYPAEDIGELMRGADITHISNEVPFAEDCPAPDPSQRNLVFCSDPSYIDLLEAVGADVIELSGDHFRDWGEEAMLFTLDLYDQHDLPYYGGGANLEEARRALIMVHNGNRFAFLGCNGKRGYASAAENHAGAVQCDYEWLQAETRRLSKEGYLVIATFQHNEVETYVPQPALIRDFGLLAAAGASIVSGSQAHQAHGVEFTDNDTLITYGLGNLFFDQIIFGYDLSHALIARHVFYDGRYISTELIPIVFVDYAKPRPCTPEERAEFLSIIFANSIWKPRVVEEE